MREPLAQPYGAAMTAPRIASIECPACHRSAQLIDDGFTLRILGHWPRDATDADVASLLGGVVTLCEGDERHPCGACSLYGSAPHVACGFATCSCWCR